MILFNFMNWPSFVKSYGLSLLFMEWVFLWNFGPQQKSTKIFSLIGVAFSSTHYLTTHKTIHTYYLKQVIWLIK